MKCNNNKGVKDSDTKWSEKRRILRRINLKNLIPNSSKLML